MDASPVERRKTTKAIKRKMNNLSVVIITHNEEKDISDCLESVSWAGEVIVVDSLSDDRTVQLCRERGAQVLENSWRGYAVNKNLGIEAAQGEWILSIDADERVTPELAREIEAVIEGDNQGQDGYLIPMKFYFLGHWMRYGGLYPKRHLRLFRKGKGKFSEKAVHEGLEVQGTTGTLKAPMLHYSYENLEDYFRKFNIYSTLDAEDKYQKERCGICYPFLRLPAEFMLTYFIKRGFLDGFPGFLYSALNAFYVFIKYLKLYEMQHLSREGK